MKKVKTNQQSTNPFVAMEEEVLDFWDRAKIFEKSVEKSAPRGNYVFYDGPPFATGEPHYGHIVASIMKDAVPRYWTMKGYRIKRRWGWDCHGLPVENLAEQELGLKQKQDIEKIGVAKFNDYCESIVLRFAEEWEKTIHRIARWVDMENDYKTMEPDFMESVWWVFKTLWQKGLIYQGYKSMHICPRCGTTLSNFEVTQGYKEIKDLAITVKFKLEPRQKIGDFVVDDKTYVLAWTTTPWTLIGNVALAVGNEINYVIFSLENHPKYPQGTYISSKDFFDNKINFATLVSSTQKTTYITSLVELKGKDLKGLKYQPLFDYYYQTDLKNKANGWQIYSADFVSTEEGTGVVHLAPAFGEEDMTLGQEKNLPFIQHIKIEGTISEEVTDFAGLPVKPIDDVQATDKKIVAWLDKHYNLFSQEQYLHSYPHCWRCETPLLNYAASSWFVKVTAIKDDLIKNNQKVFWVPEHIKNGRFGKWLEQARDWAISRHRYWGATIPVWTCDKCDEKMVVGSIAELEKLTGQKIKDLHKQFVDKITWPCQKCQGLMKRVPEVLDCWFESGSMPYGQEHYPFEQPEKFKARQPVPADFIAEGIDQTRGWFYTMMVLATALFNQPAARNIIANGIVLAENGQKMSKRLKNYPDPSEIFKKYSVDALRYYFFASPVLVAENLNFSETGVRDILRKVTMILWNVYQFYQTYKSDKKKEVEDLVLPQSENILDKWILAHLNSLIREVTVSMDRYKLPRAMRPIGEFINELSTWYLRRSRQRFKSGDGLDKQQAIEVTRYVLIQLSKIIAPFMPFLAEQLWQRVTGFNFQNGDRSVHLESWPAYAKASAGKPEVVLKEMAIVRKIVELGLSARDQAGLKVRQPVLKIKVKSQKLELGEEYQELIKDELNVKMVEFIEAPAELTVELDKTLTPDLIKEGLTREIIRLVNQLRKQAKLTLHDKIILLWQSDSQLIKEVFSQSAEQIQAATVSQQVQQGEDQTAEIQKATRLNGEKIKLTIKIT